MTIGAEHGRVLWMVPFQSSSDQLDLLLDAVEYARDTWAGSPGIILPMDVVLFNDRFGLVLQPIDKQSTRPLRGYMPCEDGPRWRFAIALFELVQQLHEGGLTSCGISREQLRCDPQTGDVILRIGHSMRRIGQVDEASCGRSDVFFSVPRSTVDACARKGMPVSGPQRDVYSAAVAAFYLLMHTHPFIGSDFLGRLRSDYAAYYQSEPKYIFEPGSSNLPGNMILDTMTTMQWEQTEPQLKRLFDQMFLAVTYPEQYWRPDLGCWDPQRWIQALSSDRDLNIDRSSPIPPSFTKEWQRLV